MSAVGVAEDRGPWTQLPLLCAAAVLLLVSRPGPGPRRRGVEASAILLAMALSLGGNALLNEYGLKPAVAVARPNIVALTEAGALGPEVAEPADFYALGDKGARRDFLRARLPEVSSPVLSAGVREHWVHETGYSFPSGHSTAAMTFAAMMVALGFAWRSGWRRVLLVGGSAIWALAVVYSRPLLGVHTPLDVSVGSAAGFGWGLLSFVLIRWAAGTFAGSGAGSGSGASEAAG